MKRFLLIALSLMLVFSLSSCGGSGTPAPGNSGTPEKFVCGVTLFEPMNFKDAAGNWTGFDTEFAQLVGEKLGWEIEFQEIAWSNKYIELSAGTIDAIWNGFTANASESDGKLRTDLVDMSYAYMYNQQCVVIKKDRAGEFKSAGDLAGKTAAAESGSAGEEAALDLIAGSGKVLGMQAQINTFMEVNAGTSDFAVVDIIIAKRMAGSGNYPDLMIMDLELAPEVYAVGFKQGDPRRAKVNGAMKELYDDGTLFALAEKYGLEPDSVTIRENIH